MILIQPPTVQNWNSLINKPSILSDNQISWDEIQNKPTTLAGYGITNGQPLGNELTALQNLSDSAGFLKKLGDGNYSIDNNNYLSLTGGTVTGVTTFSNTTPSTSTTTGASVIAGGQGIGGNQHIGGFTSLGGTAGGHPAIKMKILEGTTASTQGGQAVIYVAINRDKIISISALVYRLTGDNRKQIFTPCFTFYQGYYFDIYLDSNNSLFINNHPTNSSDILSKAFVITIFYRE